MKSILTWLGDYRIPVIVVCALSMVAAIACADEPSANGDEEGIRFFESNIRPLFITHCYKCHSDKADEPRGGLRLDGREYLLAGGDSGPAIVPGRPDDSLLIQAVRYADPDLQMPPDKQLSADDVAKLEMWVARGAPYPLPNSGSSAANRSAEHWAFESPRATSLPDVQQYDWVQNPIDCFILAKLEEQGISPQSAADKRTLLRRITYDLTGLPPTANEIDAFLADDSPRAYIHVVDRLLASPRYGERWGRHWLDLVRYSDDFEQTWRYRDWVVAAFNRDLPYNEMIVSQIAGDLVPPQPSEAVNVDGMVATTMLSIGPWGGIDRKKRLADIVDDQIDIIGRTFLGLTLACARCHDHKFDPITTADYYGLAGIFYSSRVISDAGYLSHGTKRLNIPLVSQAEVERHAHQMEQVRRLEGELKAEQVRHYAQFAHSLLPNTANYLAAAFEYTYWPKVLSGNEQPADQQQPQEKPSLADFAAQRGLHAFAVERWIDYLNGARVNAFQLLDKPVKDYDGEAGVHAWCAIAERPWWGVNTNPYDVAIETFVLPSRSVSMYPSVDGGAVAWISPMAGRVCMTGHLQDADPLDGVGIAWAIDHHSNGMTHELSSGTMPAQGSMELSDGSNSERLNVIDVQVGDVIYFESWLSQGDAHYDITNVALTITEIDGSRKWDLAEDVMDSFLQSNPHPDSQGHACTWSFYDMANSNRKARMPAVDQMLAAWDEITAAVQADQRECGALIDFLSEFQRKIDQPETCDALEIDLTGIRSPFWLRESDAANYLSAEAQAELTKRAEELASLEASITPVPSAHGVQEGGLRFSLFPAIQDVPIHVRGSYEQFGAIIPRRFPECLHSGEQPLMQSGSGRLELANWIASNDNPLAARVMVNRIWQHHFGEGIVRTPSNFGELGETPTHPELLDWLATQFVASGWSIKSLHRLIVMSATYQQSSTASPDQLKLDPQNKLFCRMNRRRLDAEQLRDSLLVVGNRLEARAGGPPDDENSRRRLLYVRTLRADKSSFGALFDAPDPAIHVEKRSTSTVAPQALELMNAPLALETAEALAAEPDFLKRPQENRIHLLYRAILGREPKSEEMAIANEFFGSFQQSSADSLEAWQAFAQALLLSNEFMFVD